MDSARTQGVIVLVGESALFGCLHEQFTPVDVPERKDRIDRHVLEAGQIVPRFIDDGNRSLSEVVDVSPVGDVV